MHIFRTKSSLSFPHFFFFEIFLLFDRMPASADLLDMFREHMDEIADPPIKADEIDPTFAKFKHQITIHIMKKKQPKQ